jgi:hypothetical protein
MIFLETLVQDNPMPKRDKDTKKEQFMIWANPGLMARYKAAAEKFGKRSGNTVALEVLETYLDHWMQAEESRRQAVREQLDISGVINRSDYLERLPALLFGTTDVDEALREDVELGMQIIKKAVERHNK